MGYNRSQVILNSTSSGTGNWHFIGDARLVSLSISTSNASASRYTISFSNDDGFQSAISYSNNTVLTLAGSYTIDPGARWIRAEQPNFALSATSEVVITLNRLVL